MIISVVFDLSKDGLPKTPLKTPPSGSSSLRGRKTLIPANGTETLQDQRE